MLKLLLKTQFLTIISDSESNNIRLITSLIIRWYFFPRPFCLDLITHSENWSAPTSLYYTFVSIQILFQVLKSWDTTTSWEGVWCVLGSKSLNFTFLTIFKKTLSLPEILPCSLMGWWVTFILISVFLMSLFLGLSVPPWTTFRPL